MYENQVNYNAFWSGRTQLNRSCKQKGDQNIENQGNIFDYAKNCKVAVLAVDII